MRKVILIVSVFAVALAFSLVLTKPNRAKDFAHLQKETVEHEESKKPKSQRIKEALKWRYDRIKNPVTGIFDPADLYAAVKKADNLKSIKSGSRGVLNLEWEALGPDNVGGRSRCFLFDKDNPELVFTGGVSGGLYKSTSSGLNWEPVESYNGFASVVSIAQANDNEGSIFVGTGEGMVGPAGNLNSFTGSHYGNGIYKSRDKGETWEQITSTQVIDPNAPAGADFANNTNWGLVNELAVSPVNPSLLLAATNSGLEISINATSGAADITFTPANGLSGQGQAIVLSPDGQFAMAAFSGRVYRNDNVQENFVNGWTIAPEITGGGRADVKIAPSNPSYVYVSKSGTDECLEGIYRSTDGGLSFTQIVFPDPGKELDPFNQPSAEFGECAGQGGYDHALAINPIDETKIYIGGIAFYTWGSGTGGIKKADEINADVFSGNYIHADKHEIVFSPHDETGNTMIVTSDGGITICTNAFSGFPDNMNFQDINKNFLSYQCYGMGAGNFGEVMSGSQDNSNQYIDLLGSSSQAAVTVGGGDGGYAEVSNLDYNIMFGSSQFGNIFRSITRGESSVPFVDGNIDGNNCSHIHCDNNAACGDGDGDFITVLHLMETTERSNQQLTAYVYARNDTLLLANGSTQVIADTIFPGTEMATSGNVSSQKFQVNLGETLFPGDTAFFLDPFDARYYVSARSCGIWVCNNPLETLEQPNFYRMTSGAPADDYASSKDGNALYTVTGGNNLIIYNNLNDIVFPEGGCDASAGACISGFQTITIPIGSGLNLVGVDVDLKDPNHVLVTSGGFGNSSRIFKVEGALTGSPVVTSLQPDDNTLPYMPIMDAVIDAGNRDRYILGTELGIWTSEDGGLTWSEDNGGIGLRLPIAQLRQEPINAQVDNNEDCYVIYAGSYARGMYKTTTLSGDCDFEAGKWPGVVTGIKAVSQDVQNILVYPNPTSALTKVAFDLENSSEVVFNIVDVTGRLVYSKSYSNMVKGNNIIEFNASDFATGNYFAVLSNNGKSFNSRIFMKR